MSLVRTNLAELDLGLKGDLTMSEAMEKLAKQLAEGEASPNLSTHVIVQFCLEMQHKV